MTFDEFFEWHQKLIHKKSEPLDISQESKDFIVQANIAIEAYCECADAAKRDREKWDLKARRLTQLRDMFKEKS